MIHLNRSLFLILFLSIPIFSQNKSDTAHARNNSHEGKMQSNSNIWHESADKLQLFNANFIVPLNLKIYQKIILNDYVAPRRLSKEELETGMTESELNSFEKNRLKFRRVLSEIYGEDLIDVESLLSALGITSEQLIWLAAILKFFLM